VISIALVALGASPPVLANVGAIAASTPIRVLFIGNSYTRSNGLPHMVERIAQEMPNAVDIEVSVSTNPGWDLDRHWEAPSTRALLVSGRYTHVVLQGHSMSPLTHRTELEGFARLFDGEIDRTGARTVLYETWARRPGSRAYRRERIADGPVDMQARISECYVELARSIDADVAPAGRAFLLAQQRVRDTDLYRSDGAHPSPAGTYLAASVLYAVISHSDVRDSGWRPYPMGRTVANELRDVAWTALQEP
jgi:hypothetical protein